MPGANGRPEAGGFGNIEVERAFQKVQKLVRIGQDAAVAATWVERGEDLAAQRVMAVILTAAHDQVLHEIRVRITLLPDALGVEDGLIRRIGGEIETERV